jgi:hypothetical protein
MDQALLKYSHHIHYARKNDPLWSLFCDNLLMNLQLMKKKHKFSIPTFPVEIISNIFKFFDANSLCRISMTSSIFCKYSSERELWANLLFREFNIKVEENDVKILKVMYKTNKELFDKVVNDSLMGVKYLKPINLNISLSLIVNFSFKKNLN